MTDDGIKAFVPQREPILMVDRMLDASGDTARTTLTVRADNIFLDEGGQMEEMGLVEHIAQSASALAGHAALEGGASAPPVGYIAEVRKFRCLRRPRVGDELLTIITLGAEAGGVSIVKGETFICGEVVASTQMKIFIEG